MLRIGSKGSKLAIASMLAGMAFAAALTLVSSGAEALCMARPMPAGYWEAHEAVRKGNVSEARRLFQQAARRPGEARAWMAGALSSQAWRAKAAGKIDEAVRFYREALRENPSNDYPAHAAVSALEGAGRLHDALLEIRGLPKKIARTSRIRLLEAQILDKIGDHDAARAIRGQLKGSVVY